MSKTEYAWVIQRDDGKFYVNTSLGKHVFTDKILLAYKDTFEWIKYHIELFKLQNCRPVKVEIKVVGE